MPKCSMAKSLPVRPNPDCTSSATSTIPCFDASSRRPCTHSTGGTTNPPSPWTGSKTIAATFSAATCVVSIRRRASSASPAGSEPGQRYGFGNGAR